ncbi:substrate-binding periplasmic protein [Atopomonas hussainii]|uniref:substrate-binding periplasmic protein n=1 Tax=Atopomonas hussainii TaxID=1429083 RepID=UPI00090010E8|nr:transporter substrate-binding domain-containing protein [Atopomonas hussainii]
MRRLCIALIWLLGGVGVASAQSLVLSVGDWPPYLSKDFKHQGVVAHLISDVLKDEGYDVRFRFLPWTRAYADAAAGKYAGTAVWMRKKEREADFLYSDPVLNEQFVFFHLQQDKFTWDKLSDLLGKKLGGGLEYSYGPEMDAYLSTGRLYMERVHTDEQNFSKLLRGRIDLYPQEVNVGYTALLTHFVADDVARITHHPKPLLNNLSFLLVPRSRPDSHELLKRFNKRLAMYRESGRYERYFHDLRQGKYLPEPRGAQEENPNSTP